MKKIVTTLVSLGALASTLSADIARLELGVGGYEQTPSGGFSYSDFPAKGTYNSQEEASTDMYAWLLIKHPLPVIPNLRLEYATLSDKGDVQGSFADFNLPVGSVATATYDVKQYDIIPYYNLIDNTFWMTVDVGVDIKMMEIVYDVSPVLTFTGYSDTSPLALPMLYLRGRVEIPATNIGLEADAKYITYNDSTAYDIRAKVDYTLGFIPVVQPAVELGYKVQKFDLISDDEKERMNMDFAGLYAGLMLRF